MRHARPICLLLLLALCLTVAACSSNKYLVHISADDKAAIRRVRVSVLHDAAPKMHPARMNVVQSYDGSTTYSILDYPRWTIEDYKMYAGQRAQEIRPHIQSLGARGITAYIMTVIEQLSASSSGATPVEVSSTVDLDAGPPGTADLKITVYYMTKPASFYLGFRSSAEMEGRTIYDYQQFSSNWNTWDQDGVDSFLQDATTNAWRDLTH